MTDPLRAALDILDVIDGIVDDTHPEGDGCPLCIALEALRAALAADSTPAVLTPEGWRWECPSCDRPVAPMGMCETCGVFGIMRIGLSGGRSPSHGGPTMTTAVEIRSLLVLGRWEDRP